MERSGDREAQSRRHAAATDITFVHRSEASGTTFIFADYLAKVSPEFKTKVGVDACAEVADRRRRQGERRRGRTGSQTPGSLGYVELVYALQTKIAVRRRAEQQRRVRHAVGRLA